MAYCPNCGTYIDDSANFCPSCGAKINHGYGSSGTGYQNPPAGATSPDVPSVGLKVLCFFFPIVGLILFCVNQNTKPVSAKAYGQMALIGFCVGIAVGIIRWIIAVAIGIPSILGILTGLGTL